MTRRTTIGVKIDEETRERLQSLAEAMDRPGPCLIEAMVVQQMP